MFKRIIFFFFLFGVLTSKTFAQVNVKDSAVFVPLLPFYYSAQLPAGDMEDRFGFSSSVGTGVTIKTRENWLLGVEGCFIFGSKIFDTTLFKNITTSDGFIINNDGSPATVNTYERGFNVSAHVGRVFSIWSPNRNCGPYITLGVGLLQHKIKIQTKGGVIPQLTKEYIKGYDKLTNGISFNEFLGYMFLGNKRRVNFFAGFEFTQAFTKSRRSYDFDLMKKDNTQRLDMLYGFRAGWILPIYKKRATDFYYR